MQVQLVGFRVGGEFYAINILSVLQIIPYKAPLKVAQVPAFIEGIIHLRGMVIPIVDLRRRFGAPIPTGDDAGRILILRVETPAGEQHVGLAADSTTQVIRTDADKFLRAPEVLLRGDTAYTGEVYEDDESRTYMVLDPRKILSPSEQRQLGGVADVPPAPLEAAS